jgi:hypothetical protein
MVEVRVGQQQEVYFGGIKPERLGIFFLAFPAALEHAAIHQQFPASTFDEVAGPGDAASCAVERQFHRRSPQG